MDPRSMQKNTHLDNFCVFWTIILLLLWFRFYFLMLHRIQAKRSPRYSEAAMLLIQVIFEPE